MCVVTLNIFCIFEDFMIIPSSLPEVGARYLRGFRPIQRDFCIICSISTKIRMSMRYTLGGLSSICCFSAVQRFRLDFGYFRVIDLLVNTLQFEVRFSLGHCALKRRGVASLQKRSDSLHSRVEGHGVMESPLMRALSRSIVCLY